MGQVQLILEEEDSVSSVNGRDNKGRFAKGNHFSPLANEIKGRYLRLRNAALKSVSEHDVNDVVQTILTMAKGGDLGAARLLFQFVISNHSKEDSVIEKDDDNIMDVPSEYTQRLKTIHPNLFRITNGRDHRTETSTQDSMASR